MREYTHVSVDEEGDEREMRLLAMTKGNFERPRDEHGNFIEIEKVQSENEVVFMISDFESRVIGDRLHRAAERYEKLFKGNDILCRLDQDCRFWAKRFLTACSTREKNDDEYYNQGKKRHIDSNYNICIKMTSYECWSLGHRLFEIGDWFEDKGYDRIANETKWLARRFHAEEKEVRNE
jgi:hypothetical protein